MSNRDTYLPIVREKAASVGLDWKLLDAIILAESNYQPFAVRYEAKSKYLASPTKFAKLNFITTETEEVCQRMSWSFCQIMGSSARSLGFQGPLPSLCEINLSLDLMCKFLLQLWKRYPNDLSSVISAYNAGTAKKDERGKFLNQAYIDKVQAFILAKK